MSGVCGIVDFAVPRLDPEPLRRMARFSAYRGPDGIRFHTAGPAGFAHLALDAVPESVPQPLVDPRSGAWVVLDGRLDNRAELIGLVTGPRDRAALSDAGLVLAAYARWGEDCARHLLGDFAFAIWDERRRRLLCAVDPAGVKPLYYARRGSLFCFGSDALQVLQHPALPKGVNEAAIAAYLANRAEEPGQSYFAAVSRLRQGHWMVVGEDGGEPQRYWPTELPEIRYARDEDYADHFRELLQQAVADRLRAPGSWVGVAMSGGLDSTAVAALAARQPEKRVCAWSLVFDRIAECDERPYIRAVTEDLGIDSETVDAEEAWTLEGEDAPPYSPDDPMIGWQLGYRRMHRSLRARGGRVFLMGHGADDLLRGSDLVFADRLRRGDGRAVLEVLRHGRESGKPAWQVLYRYLGRPLLPSKADRILRRALGKHGEPAPPWIDPDFARRTRGERRGAERPAGSLARRDLRVNLAEIQWYQRIVSWHDRNAAVSGVEVRHPFLDRRLFEYVLAIPPEQLFRFGSYKSLLRRAMTGVLPEVVRSRPDKTRFAGFMEYLIREKEPSRVEEILAGSRAEALGIFDGRRLRQAYAAYRTGRTHEWKRDLWYALSLELWLMRFEKIVGGQGSEPLLETDHRRIARVAG